MVTAGLVAARKKSVKTSTRLGLLELLEFVEFVDMLTPFSRDCFVLPRFARSFGIIAHNDNERALRGPRKPLVSFLPLMIPMGALTSLFFGLLEFVEFVECASFTLLMVYSLSLLPDFAMK